MLILTIRTDNPEAEIGLYNDNNKLEYETWQAHRELADTLHLKIEVLLKSQQKEWADIEGIVAYQGPGSFTGLRIGLTVVNMLSYSLKVPAVGQTKEDWIKQGIARLQKGESDQLVMPEYGAPVHITQQKR